MSGSGEAAAQRIVLVDIVDGQVSAYVRALALLPQEVEWVLVGGLAANVRIAHVHRATNDVDTVATDVDRIVEVLVALEDTERLSAAKVQLHHPDVEVDVMHSTEGRTLPLEPRDRAFALARRFAMRSATSAEIAVVDRHGEELESVSVRVGSRAALIALKTLSFPERKDGSYPHKVGSDIQDLYRLVSGEDLEGIAENLVAADVELASFIAAELVHNFAASTSNLRFNHLRLQRFPRNVDAEAIAQEDLTVLASLGDLVIAISSDLSGDRRGVES